MFGNRFEQALDGFGSNTERQPIDEILAYLLLDATVGSLVVLLQIIAECVQFLAFESDFSAYSSCASRVN